MPLLPAPPPPRWKNEFGINIIVLKEKNKTDLSFWTFGIEAFFILNTRPTVLCGLALASRTTFRAFARFLKVLFLPWSYSRPLIEVLQLGHGLQVDQRRQKKLRRESRTFFPLSYFGGGFLFWSESSSRSPSSPVTEREKVDKESLEQMKARI